jgi:hypothetical protein
MMKFETSLDPKRAWVLALSTLAILICSSTYAIAATGGRYFEPTEGFTQVKDLPDDFSGHIQSFVIHRKDALKVQRLIPKRRGWFLMWVTSFTLRLMNGW